MLIHICQLSKTSHRGNTKRHRNPCKFGTDILTQTFIRLERWSNFWDDTMVIFFQGTFDGFSMVLPHLDHYHWMFFHKLTIVFDGFQKFKTDSLWWSEASSADILPIYLVYLLQWIRTTVPDGKKISHGRYQLYFISLTSQELRMLSRSLSVY